MRILVTGAAGFVGSHMAERLKVEHHVISLVRLGKIGDLERLFDAGVHAGVVWHDLRSPLPLTVRERIGPIDAIIHMGGETHVDRSITCPEDFVMSNVVGTMNLLDYARHIDLQGPFIYFSTDEVFGPAPEGFENSEYDPYHANNPYAATKAGAEQLVIAYANTYGLKSCIIRSMNIFGERQHREKFIPMTIKKVLLGETVQIHASSDLARSGSRFYIYAKNVADGVVHVMKHGKLEPRKTAVYHIVGEREVSNLEMANIISDLVGHPLRYEMVNFHASRPGHDLRYAMKDTSMMEIGWHRPESFEMSLGRTVQWYLSKKSWLGL